MAENEVFKRLREKLVAAFGKKRDKTDIAVYDEDGNVVEGVTLVNSTDVAVVKAFSEEVDGRKLYAVNDHGIAIVSAIDNNKGSFAGFSSEGNFVGRSEGEVSTTIIKISNIATKGEIQPAVSVIEFVDSSRKLFKMKDGVQTDEEITSWDTLFSLTKKGLIRLYYLANGTEDTGRKALYTAHMVDDKEGSIPSILFDATGFIDTNTVWTRTITMTKVGDDGINVSVGKLTEVAKKGDLSNLLSKDDWSKITSKDIDDFKKYKGVVIDENHIFTADCNAGDIVTENKESYYVLLWGAEVGDSAASIGMGSHNATDGFKKLVELYEKNKATLFSDTAFIEAVKKYGAPQYKKDENGEWYQEVEI